MRQVKHPARARDETIVDFVRQHYCVCGPDGREEVGRLERAVEAVEAAEAARQEWLPELPGVPHLRYRIDTAVQIPEAVHRFHPEVERDPRLHALSFVDPLAVAQELGIAVSPAVARIVRRGLAGTVTFDRRSLDSNGQLRGLGTIRWRPKALPERGRR